MQIKDIFNNKELKPKQKTESIASALVEKEISIKELIAYAECQKAPIKATCMEALEYLTQKNPQLATENCLHFALANIHDKAPRLVWESTRVIGNIIHLFPDKTGIITKALFENTEHDGTVVRWSTAFALSQVYKATKTQNQQLATKLAILAKKEEKNSIKKIYLAAIKEK